MSELIRSELEPDGILVATIDMPGRTMNVFSPELMDAFDTLMNRVENEQAIRGVILTSGKPTFLAGADLVMVQGFTESAKNASHEQMFALCGRLGRQFVRLELSDKPWVAAVNGIALGGGLELALACRARLVIDDPRTQLGVPEVRWGLLPGAGGTQRLPRLAGMHAAIDLLLSGRSISPVDAVRLGIFFAAVPKTRLMDEARSVARSLFGKPYDANAKFRAIAQADIPLHSDETARAIAARHGVSDDDFAHYPAYGAIVDSVLKGARLTLAEATDVEMHQFLRLMFDPVAGRMVRILFLERLRAEREQPTLPEAQVECLFVGEISAACNAWIQALAKAKIPQAMDSALPSDTVDLVTVGGSRHRVKLHVLDGGATPVNGSLAVLSPEGPYGRVMEIVGSKEGAGMALAALAARLRSLPWHTPGPESVLQRMHGRSLEEQARIARACAFAPGAGDPVFLDVAACLAGVAPAWSGGPLTWSSEQRLSN